MIAPDYQNSSVPVSYGVQLRENQSLEVVQLQ